MYNLGSNDRENIISHNCNVRERAGFCCDSICDLIMTLKTYCSSCCLLVGSTQPSFLFRWQSGCYGPSELRALPSIPGIREWIWERGEGFGEAGEAEKWGGEDRSTEIQKENFPLHGVRLSPPWGGARSVPMPWAPDRDSRRDAGNRLRIISVHIKEHGWLVGD